jgi:hypothetical protein
VAHLTAVSIGRPSQPSLGGTAPPLTVSLHHLTYLENHDPNAHNAVISIVLAKRCAIYTVRGIVSTISVSISRASLPDAAGWI